MYRTILIVEDDAPFRDVIGRNLRARGYDVRESETAAGALEEITRVRPDLMLLDINLPDRTGWDILRDLHDRHIKVPTIVISAARVSPARLDEFKPIAFLPRPFPLEALLRLVENGGQAMADGSEPS